MAAGNNSARSKEVPLVSSAVERVNGDDWSWSSSNPKRNLTVYMTQFITVHLILFVVITVGLYNLTITAGTNKEMWVAIVSGLIGVIVPSPAAMKGNKFIYSTKQADAAGSQPTPIST